MQGRWRKSAELLDAERSAKLARRQYSLSGSTSNPGGGRFGSLVRVRPWVSAVPVWITAGADCPDVCNGHRAPVFRRADELCHGCEELVPIKARYIRIQGDVFHVTDLL